MTDYEVMMANGHSAAKSAEIVLDAKRGDEHARKWIALIRKMNGAEDCPSSEGNRPTLLKIEVFDHCTTGYVTEASRAGFAPGEPMPREIIVDFYPYTTSALLKARLTPKQTDKDLEGDVTRWIYSAERSDGQACEDFIFYND